MAGSGALEKLLVLAFETAEDASRGGRQEAADEFEALINPESYTLEHTVELDDSQGQGTSGTEAVYTHTPPQKLAFDFLFDSSGIINGTPTEDGVLADVVAFRKLLTDFVDETHEPYHLKLVWGGLVFTGRAASVTITYSLFAPDGMPIRALVAVQFTGSIADERRLAEEARKSPDLAHQRIVRPGDTLPLLCHLVYGDSRHYLRVAEANGLDDVRSLVVGSSLLFPRLPEEVRSP